MAGDEATGWLQPSQQLASTTYCKRSHTLILSWDKFYFWKAIFFLKYISTTWKLRAGQWKWVPSALIDAKRLVLQHWKYKCMKSLDRVKNWCYLQLRNEKMMYRWLERSADCPLFAFIHLTTVQNYDGHRKNKVTTCLQSYNDHAIPTVTCW